MHSRRDFVQLLGASLALAGLDGCTRMPASDILPYVRQPELTPGVPQYYATSMVLDGFATGLLVESRDGRPTKIEGHPDHPASLGAAGVLEQASVLQLYDPDRAAAVRHGGGPSSWEALAAALAPDRLRTQLGARGAGLFLLLEPTSSPLEQMLLDRLRELYADARIHFRDAIAAPHDALLPQYDFRSADVVVFADADVLAAGPFHLRHARDFAARRRPESSAGMSRCYALESSPSPTGAVADHRFAMRPGAILSALERLAAYVSNSSSPPAVTDDPVAAIARDLLAHRGRSLVIAGGHLPGAARVLARRINDAVDNTSRTTWYSRSPLAGAGDPSTSFAAFLDALHAGAVDTLICAAANPSYASAGAADVGSLLRRIRQSVYFGLYQNETARDCQWIAPAAHYLESWGDARAYDGTLSVVQPLLQPSSARHTTGELLSLLLGSPAVRAYQLLRESWQSRGLAGPASAFEVSWRAVLARGFVENSAFPREAAPPPAALDERAFAPAPIEVVFRPDPRVHDGSFGNNAWLQELPDPVTTLTWDNAAELSRATARRLAIESGEWIDLQAGGRALRIPALVVPGHADDCVTVRFGYGRDGSERVARGVGTNVFRFWAGGMYVLPGVQVARAEGVAARRFAITQPHHALETSNAARVMTLDEYEHHRPSSRRLLTLYEPPVGLPDGPAPHQWAMTVDLGACIGCGACVVACQAENNVPVVGRDQVLRGREMHWLRIDWYAPAADAPPLLRQPMLCQQCEKAPCEYVCPVEATVHSRDGLNEMVYNRCVGTRFCSNNCPYKVRRFNWLDFNSGVDAVTELVKNPDVTVRERGVMEKCTFCVQRIRGAEIAARADGRELRADDVRTACQQTCPSQAITFGSLTDAGSRVNQERASRRAYSVLEELGTEPRVRYLAAVRNPNPDLEKRS